MTQTPEQEQIASLTLQLAISEAQRIRIEELYTILSDKYQALYKAHNTFLKNIHDLSQLPR